MEAHDYPFDLLVSTEPKFLVYLMHWILLKQKLVTQNLGLSQSKSPRDSTSSVVCLSGLIQW